MSGNSLHHKGIHGARVRVGRGGREACPHCTPINQPPMPHSCLEGSGAASASTTIAEREWQALRGSGERGRRRGRRRERAPEDRRNGRQEEGEEDKRN